MRLSHCCQLSFMLQVNCIWETNVSSQHNTDKASFFFAFKVLLRQNFDVMFIIKKHLYQLIEEDCNLKFD